MKRGRALALLFLAAGSTLLTTSCSSAPTELERRNAELVRQHTEIWDLMGLSPGAKEELNAIVLDLNGQMYHNKAERPEAYQQASAVKRSQPKTREEYMAAHKKRFDLLKISELTQKELLASADFVWTALHDPSVPEEKKKVAETIRQMITSFKGPPPCCDENIFQRAARP